MINKSQKVSSLENIYKNLESGMPENKSIKDYALPNARQWLGGRYLALWVLPIYLFGKIATTGTTYLSASYHSVGFYIERNINNGNAGSGTVNSVNSQILTFDYNGNNTSSDQGVSGQACLYNHNSSSVYKRIIFEGCADKANDIASMTIGHGTYKANKNAFTAIKFEMGAGNIASGSITMYGIKDA